MKASTPKIVGLSSREAEERLKKYGLNKVGKEKRFTDLELFLNQFKSPYILLLLFTALLSAILGETIDALVIITIVLLGSILDFWQERGAHRTVEKLLSMVKTYVNVIRDGKEMEIPIEYVVPDDIVVLRAGDMVPADGVLLEAKDIFINESLLTGEPYPVEKFANDKVFMGTHVVSGFGIMKAVKTAKDTEYGKIADKLRLGKAETDFERGLRRFGYTLLEVATILIIVVFAVNTYYHRGVIDSLLFALSLGIGITPVLLPAVVSVGLSYGARFMANKGAIVKRLASIENFGSMNVFCCDKTGTLTEGKMKIFAFKNIKDQDDSKVAIFSCVNSCLQTGYKNPIDDAIKESQKDLDISDYKKLDEIPYDFNRKRLSILVKKDDKNVLITKGAYSHIIEVCKYAEIDGKILDIKDTIQDIEKLYTLYSSQGYKLIAVSYKYVDKERIDFNDESDEIFIGFVILHDPLKSDAKDLVSKLKDLGIELRIITGDNKLVAQHIAQSLGLDGKVLSGEDIRHLSEDALINKVKDTFVFAELTPLQKDLVVSALKDAGYVVGYMGDGINDIAAMREADVAISVDNAVDIAKETADIVLLKADLQTIIDAVVEGRKTFLNTMKYLFMEVSSNFGNVFSMTGASFIIPFLPMLPKQVLTQNLMSDAAVMSIPTDNVDKDWIKTPKKWNIEFIKRFMIVFGLISSVYDFITYFSLMYVFNASQELFRSAWFLEGLSTQVAVLLVLRTRKIFLKSKPSNFLILTVSLIFISGFIIPFTPIGKLLELQPLTLSLYLFVIIVIILYILTVEIGKKFFYKKYDL
ncbi:magnesium-translocating P-type ATPase [Sulfurihydrogenibium sp.]|jgi:Mg2+-importing ATPase|uniref:magnesium-translocating P-type ATPase n=1 Tax=Sulfurihydrogenibium sp. TaxID=2053621 RepID=UPI002621C88D|nr:magnesium-translocating P-type ATPase [Sulfurihydrogenibium sp.]